MNNENNIIISVFSGATETRTLEFKEGFNWEVQDSAKLRDELVKAVLAMSNIPGGGTIILGIRTDTKKKKIYPEGMSLKDAQSFIKSDEHIKTVVHGYCHRPIEFEIKQEPHPENKDKWFLIFQVGEFVKWPTITARPSKTKENNGNTPVIEHHTIYTRSKLAQWASIKAGPQEIEDIVETAVKKYDVHVQSLGYVRNTPRSKEINSWFTDHQNEAIQELKKIGIVAYMEVMAKFTDSDLLFEKSKLRDAARESTISTFGWPIAVFLDNRDEFRPVVEASGIKAIISITKDALEDGKRFDYWAIHTSGAFYMRKSLFEDIRNPAIISFNTRVVRITEVFMYLRNLYLNLGIDSKKEFEITIKHGGIKGRKLGTLSQNRLMLRSVVAGTDEVSTTINTNINAFQDNPSDVVEKITDPLFENFDFFKLDRKILEQIVTDYMNGKVT